MSLMENALSLHHLDILLRKNPKSCLRLRVMVNDISDRGLETKSIDLSEGALSRQSSACLFLEGW